MPEERATAERLAAYSDAVFAVIVTIMVLELEAPEDPEFSALWHLWPTAVSYAVSYLFIAIIWINHHHLMRFVGLPTLGLIWVNFAHLFLVSLLPLRRRGSRERNSLRRRLRCTQRCSCASTSLTTSSSATCWLAPTPPRCPRARGDSRDSARSPFWRSSRRLCSWPSSHPALASR